MAAYANKYNMLVAMANHNQPTGNWAPIGKSAIWSNTGLLACASNNQNSLVVTEKLNDKNAGYPSILYLKILILLRSTRGAHTLVAMLGQAKKQYKDTSVNFEAPLRNRYKITYAKLFPESLK